MSVTDLKHILRKYDFPECAKEALIRTEQVLVGRGSSSNIDVALDVIAEFVFYETERRGVRQTSGLTPLQELQLIDVLCNYLSSCANEITKNTVFLTLFGGVESVRRQRILGILSSMALSGTYTPVLLPIGVWLQQMGCSSTQSLQLVENMIQDNFYRNKVDQARLRALAATAPRFVANFMTAMTELFMREKQPFEDKMPPMHLLEVVTAWVFVNPTLCMAAQLNPAALPSGAIPMAAISPLAGLIHWCTLAPIYKKEVVVVKEVFNKYKKIIPIEAMPKEAMIQQVKFKPLTEDELYLKMHFGILNSLRAVRRTQGSPTAVNAQHLASVAPLVQAYGQEVIQKGGDVATDEKLQKGLDLLGQAVLIALTSGCMYGNINSFLDLLSTLPENRLIKMIIENHRQA